jgi:hypothetical protein
MSSDRKTKALGLAGVVAFGLGLLAILPPADDQPPVHDPLVEMQPDPTRAPATWCGGGR